jgi:hypothetical protein
MPELVITVTDGEGVVLDDTSVTRADFTAAQENGELAKLLLNSLRVGK